MTPKIDKSKMKTLSAQDIADAFGVSWGTVISNAKKGRIPSMRLGRQFRFDPEAVALALSNTARKPHKRGGNPK